MCYADMEKMTHIVELYYENNLIPILPHGTKRSSTDQFSLKIHQTLTKYDSFLCHFLIQVLRETQRNYEYEETN